MDTLLDLEEVHIHDVLIIGAGPCGLAVAARLREKTPSALFTDSEHQRYHWMKSSASARRNSKPTKTSRHGAAADRLLGGSSLQSSNGDSEIDIAVLDSSGGSWMSAWDDKFDRLKIDHLRSPMFFHPDPRDRDGLLGYAYLEGRENELREIAGVVGKSLSKHQRKKTMKNRSRKQEMTYLDERSRPDYYRPSTSLFRSYCTDVTCRYNMSSLVNKSEVLFVEYSMETSTFKLRTSTGTKKARIVVFAAGPASKPNLPTESPFQTHPQGSVAHIFEKSSCISSRSDLLPNNVLSKIAAKKRTNVIVIGGGLSSAQVSSRLSKEGVTKVWHLIRGNHNVKHFDLDLSWLGKYKNFELASFWTADTDEERAEMIKEARNGGSITPEFKKILMSLVAKGLLELREQTVVSSANWDENSQTWEVETKPPMELPPIDHVIYATGLAADWNRIEFIKPLLREYPINTVGGMPCLTNDLMLHEEVPFFVTGRLAGLRIGPGAGNLDGARQGSERIAWKVTELLSEGPCQSDSGYGSDWDMGGEVDQRRLGLGIENQFGILDIDSEE